jgi:aspartyl-tRNA(Asn)/glutamyl-tRNA(Gln) amidotransferase subunit C
VIERDEVLHVARLARLALTEAEVEAMRGELASVLSHIAKMDELDLEGVPPSTHVVQASGALRADVRRPSLSRSAALSQAPAVSEDGEGFLVPSPQA